MYGGIPALVSLHRVKLNKKFDTSIPAKAGGSLLLQAKKFTLLLLCFTPLLCGKPQTDSIFPGSVAENTIVEKYRFAAVFVMNAGGKFQSLHMVGQIVRVIRE